VPRVPPCEIYCHSLSDRSILGPGLAQSDAQTLTLFGLHMPARLFREDHDEMLDLALSHTLESLNSVLAEPIQDVLMRDASGAYCLEAKTPVQLERDLGLPGGNIFHRSLQWPWAERPEEVGAALTEIRSFHGPTDFLDALADARLLRAPRRRGARRATPRGHRPGVPES